MILGQIKKIHKSSNPLAANKKSVVNKVYKIVGWVENGHSVRHIPGEMVFE
jgi:hypothetical protein